MNLEVDLIRSFLWSISNMKSRNYADKVLRNMLSFSLCSTILIKHLVSLWEILREVENYHSTAAHPCSVTIFQHDNIMLEFWCQTERHMASVVTHCYESLDFFSVLVFRFVCMAVQRFHWETLFVQDRQMKNFWQWLEPPSRRRKPSMLVLSSACNIDIFNILFHLFIVFFSIIPLSSSLLLPL